MNFQIQVLRGVKPDYASQGVAESVLRKAFGYQPAATAFVTGADGRDYAFVFPTLFYQDPQLPGLEFVRGANGTFVLSRVLNNVTMGSGRDFAVISDGTQGVSRFVIVDHGPEYSAGYSTWPFGHAWVATDSGNGFAFQKVSTVAAFHHAVDTGDINGDGRIDFVASHMGVKAGGVYTDLHAYLQQPDGSYRQDSNFASTLSGSWGSGAVALADVNGATGTEVIQVNYVPSGSGDWGAIRILGRTASGDYQVTQTLARQGLFTTMGATRVVPFDYDLDGDLDLAISLEGSYPGLTGQYTGNGLELYQNDGKGGFTPATAQLLARNAWPFSELQFREFSVIDFDGDGYQDIVLNGWNGSLFSSAAGKDLKPLLLRNEGGAKFTPLSALGATGLVVPAASADLSYLRVMESTDEGLELFGITANGSPETLRVLPLYRDASETMDVRGAGTSVHGFAGDDRFNLLGRNLKIDGDAGTDTAVIAGSLSGYTLHIDRARKSVEVAAKTGTAEGRHVLTEVERVQFGAQVFDLFNPARSAPPAYKANQSFLFDAAYYLLSNSTLATSVTMEAAFSHYVSTGAALGLRPNAWFDASYYSNRWADLRSANLDPATLFAHYNLYGVWEGRSAGPRFQAYDGERYLRDNPDVAAYVDGRLADFLNSRTNGAIAHYVIYGADEGRLAYDTSAVKLDALVVIGA